MEGYDAVVYDLDGTLVHLDVDWDATHQAVVEGLRGRGVSVGEQSLWEITANGEAIGERDLIEATIADHEREGARRAARLATADRLPLSVPVGVCSLNCEAACRIALELHDLDGFVEAVVGRDTLGSHKPDPEPLLRTIESLGADPAQSLFVGDSPRDEETARRAGVAFEYVSDH